MKKVQVIGLMSGSSLDGVDVALCEFEYKAKTDSPFHSWELLEAETVPFSPVWRERLTALPDASGRELVKCHAQFGHFLGKTALKFMQKHSINPDLIASHGHTIFHFPEEQFTSQIGDGAAIAAVSGIPVAADFRTTDVALGGQGAPFAPLADKWLFPGYDFYLNLGGIANISCPASEKAIAFDTGAANQVLNFLAQKARLEFDENGRLAASGERLPDLQKQIDQLPYFSQAYPKSLGNHWIQRAVIPIFENYDGSIADKLHTACHHIAFQIARSMQSILEKEAISKPHLRMLATGGGAHNGFLMDCIRAYCKKVCSFDLEVPEAIQADFKEAALMALMGWMRFRKMPNVFSSVTGASRDSIGGAIFEP